MKWNENNPICLIFSWIFAIGVIPWIIFSSNQVGTSGYFTLVYIAFLLNENTKKQRIASSIGAIFSITLTFYVYFNKNESGHLEVLGYIINFFFILILLPFLLPKKALGA